MEDGVQVPQQVDDVVLVLHVAEGSLEVPEEGVDARRHQEPLSKLLGGVGVLKGCVWGASGWGKTGADTRVYAGGGDGGGACTCVRVFIR